MHQQLAGAVRAHPGKIGREVAAFLFEGVATGAVRQEEFVAVLDIARLFHFRPEPGGELVLLLLLGTFQFVNHRVGARGDRLVRMRAEPMQVRRAERQQINLLVRQRLHQRKRPVGAREQLAEHRFAQFTGHSRVSRDQLCAHRRVPG